jgi:tetratricopeptide (TPR) repeat protein
MSGCRGTIRSLLMILAAALPDLADALPAAASFKFLKPGMEAPEFTVRTLDDRDVTLASLKQNRASLLVFWATWSPKSEPVLREAQALADRHGASGLAVVAVNLNRPEVGPQERAQSEEAVRTWKLTVPVALDAGFALASTVGVVANPALALIDARGVLLWDNSGWSRSVQEGLREQVESALGLRTAPSSAATAAPRHAPAHKALLNFNLARTFLRQGNKARAQGLLESAAELDQAWAAPRTYLGHLLLDQGGDRALEQAVAQFRAAVAIDAGDVSALTGYGDALLRQNHVKEAAALLEKAHASDPTFTPAVAGRATALARLGQPADAIGLFDAALELNPRDPAIYAGRASCREVAGDLGAAAADYRRAVEILIGRR